MKLDKIMLKMKEGEVKGKKKAASTAAKKPAKGKKKKKNDDVDSLEGFIVDSDEDDKPAKKKAKTLKK